MPTLRHTFRFEHFHVSADRVRRYRRIDFDVPDLGRLRRRSNQTTGDIHYVVTGAGGALREARPDNADYRFKGVSARSLLDAWATERHFLLVEVDRNSIAIDAYGADGRRVPLQGGPVQLPVEIQRR